MVVGPVARTKSIFAEHARFLRAENRPAGEIHPPRPMTMVDTLYDGYYRSGRSSRASSPDSQCEARELEALGINVIQFDEPAFNVFMDEVRDWGRGNAGGRRGRTQMQDRGAHLLRLRHQGQQRLEKKPWARNGASTNPLSRCWQNRKSTRYRSNAPTPEYRWN